LNASPPAFLPPLLSGLARRSPHALMPPCACAPQNPRTARALRVGTGLSVEQRRDLRERIAPLLRDARAPDARPPHFYKLSGAEKPDYW
jgi:hypothetical protein